MPLKFRSEVISPEVLAHLKDGKAQRIHGVLEVQGRELAVELDVKADRAGSLAHLHAHLETTFTALGIAVPAVGPGGMIAKPSDRVELLGQLRLDSGILTTMETDDEHAAPGAGRAG